MLTPNQKDSAFSLANFPKIPQFFKLFMISTFFPACIFFVYYISLTGQENASAIVQCHSVYRMS